MLFQNLRNGIANDSGSGCSVRGLSRIEDFRSWEQEGFGGFAALGLRVLGFREHLHRVHVQLQRFVLKTLGFWYLIVEGNLRILRETAAE